MQDALRAVCLEFASDVNPFEKHISEAEKLLNRYELKLNEYNVTTKGQTDVVTLNEVSLADEAWHNEMAEGKPISFLFYETTSLKNNVMICSHWAFFTGVITPFFTK